MKLTTPKTFKRFSDLLKGGDKKVLKESYREAIKKDVSSETLLKGYKAKKEARTVAAARAITVGVPTTAATVGGIHLYDKHHEKKLRDLGF